MGRIIKTLIIEQREGSNGKEQSYNFMFEQRGEEALVLNIDTGVWKIDSGYRELAKMAETENTGIRIGSNGPIYDQLMEDKLISQVSDEAKYEELTY